MTQPCSTGSAFLLGMAGLVTTASSGACPTTLPPAPVAVPGFATSMAGCIGAQKSDATQKLAWTVDCSADGLNLTAATERVAALCVGTPGCAAFSIDSPSFTVPRKTGKLMCEIHPDTIAQGSEPNPDWNVWQKNGAPKPGEWPYPKGTPPGPPPPPPTPPSAPEASLVWTTPSSGVSASMPLGNGKLGVSEYTSNPHHTLISSEISEALLVFSDVWADATDTVWLLLSHVDALDENTNLDKLGRIAVRATTAEGAPLSAQPASASGPSQSFRQEMHLENATVHIDIPSGVSVDVWVDATTDAVRVVSTSASPHKLEATLEVWRNTTMRPEGRWCPGPPGTKSPACVQGELLGCLELHPHITLHADIVKRTTDGIFFYHRNLGEQSSSVLPLFCLCSILYIDSISLDLYSI